MESTPISEEAIEEDVEYSKAARSAWARLIKKVYEVDPLICPYCGGEMRFTRHIPVARPSGQLKLFKITPGNFVLRS